MTTILECNGVDYVSARELVQQPDSEEEIDEGEDFNIEENMTEICDKSDRGSKTHQRCPITKFHIWFRRQLKLISLREGKSRVGFKV